MLMNTLAMTTMCHFRQLGCDQGLPDSLSHLCPMLKKGCASRESNPRRSLKDLKDWEGSMLPLHHWRFMDLCNIVINHVGLHVLQSLYYMCTSFT
jgi:hypothetical protein